MDQSNLNVMQLMKLDIVKDYDCDILYHPSKANVVADAFCRKSPGSSDGVSSMRISVDSPLLGLIRRLRLRVFGKRIGRNIGSWVRLEDLSWIVEGC